MASGRVKRDKVGYWKDKGNRYEALCNSRKSAEVLMQLFGSNEGLSEEEIVDKDIVVQILNGAMGSGLPDAVNAAQGSNTFYEEAFNPKVLDAQVAKGLMTKDSLEYKTKCAIYKCAVETKRVLEADLDSYILVGDIKKGETLEDAKMRELIAHHCVSVEASIADVVQACKEQGISPEVEQMARVVKTHDEREITAEEAHEYELQRAVLSAARAELGRVDTPQSKAALRMITRMLNGTMQSPEELQVFLETIVSDNRGFTDDAYRNSTSTNEFLQKILLRNITTF